MGAIPGLGRFPEEEMAPFQLLLLENSMDRGTPQAQSHKVLGMTEQLSTREA